METATTGRDHDADRLDAEAVAWFDRADALDRLADEVTGRLDGIERAWTTEVFVGTTAQRGHAALLDQVLSLGHAVRELREDADRARALGHACRDRADELRVALLPTG